MAIESIPNEVPRICNHCERAIPSANYDLHYAYCLRNLKKCEICGDMVLKGHAEEHFNDNHAPVACLLCNETVEREMLTVHEGENCPQRIIACEFCEFPSAAVDLTEHQEMCGNRTEFCLQCGKYIRLRELSNHESICNVDSVWENASYQSSWEEEESAEERQQELEQEAADEREQEAADEREQELKQELERERHLNDQLQEDLKDLQEKVRKLEQQEQERERVRQLEQELSHKRLLVSIAMTGIAVLVGFSCIRKSARE